MRQLVYTMFISNNRPSFHLWWKENLAKLQQVSKYYEKDCLQIFLLLFMSLLPTKFVKNSHIWGKIYFIFLKNMLKQTRNSFNQISSSVKSLLKQLPAKTNFSSIFRLNCSNSRSKQCGRECWRIYSPKISETLVSIKRVSLRDFC